MVKLLLPAAAFLLAGDAVLYAIERFPPPDFESGYTLPVIEQAGIKPVWRSVLDIFLLLAALSLAAYLVHWRRSRRGVFVLTLACLLYFGFYRKGCVCSVGSLQNIVEALTVPNSAVTWTILAFFLLPLLFALFFGRVFCAAVCPLGALQEILLVKGITLPRRLNAALSLFPPIYLAAAILFVVTGTSYLICHDDPFVAIFRLSGTRIHLIVAGIFLLLSLFIGRPYCRFICPYGVLLRFCARVSQWRIRVTPEECIQCRLCEKTCPYSAIHPPVSVAPLPRPGRQRLYLILALLAAPALIWAFSQLAQTAAVRLSLYHPSVAVAESYAAIAQRYQAGEELPPRLLQRVVNHDHTQIYRKALEKKRQFVVVGAYLGGAAGLIIALRLIGLSIFRPHDDYCTDRGECLACARCFPVCPQQRIRYPQTPGAISDGFDYPQKLRPFYPRTMLLIFGAATLLALLAAGLLYHRGTPDSALAFLKNRQVDKMRQDLQKFPDDAAQRDALRQYDLERRQTFFRHLRFLDQGRYVLLILAVLALAALKVYLASRPALPERPPGRQDPMAGLRPQLESRQGLLLAILLAAALTGYWTLRQTPGITAESIAVLTAVAPLPVKPPAYEPPAAAAMRTQWPTFRGPFGQGHYRAEGVVTQWNEAAGQNILWKTPLDLPGFSSPVIWADRLFITAADKNRRMVYCLDTQNGKILWQQPVAQGYNQVPNIHPDTGYAPCTPAADGHYVYAIFTTGHLACFDMEGQRVWERSFAPLDNLYGYSTSLTYFQQHLFVLIDQGYVDDNLSRLYALDPLTGNTNWQQSRPVSGSWNTPVIIHPDGEPQLITASNPWLIAYRPADGTELWRADCLGADIAPSPVLAGKLVIAVQPNAHIVAVDPSGSGDVTNTHVRWTSPESAPDITSPLANDTYVWSMMTGGQFTCCRAEDGQLVYQHDFGKNFSSSPTLVNDTIYLFCETGQAFILAAGPEFRILQENALDGRICASPAFRDTRLFIRAGDAVYCLGVAP